MVIDPGEHLALPAIREYDPADQVELPQVHRRLTLPPAVLAFVLLGLRGDQPVAGQDPVHCRPRRNLLQVLLAQFVADPAGTPPRVLTA